MDTPQMNREKYFRRLRIEFLRKVREEFDKFFHTRIGTLFEVKSEEMLCMVVQAHAKSKNELINSSFSQIAGASLSFISIYSLGKNILIILFLHGAC